MLYVSSNRSTFPWSVNPTDEHGEVQPVGRCTTSTGSATVRVEVLTDDRKVPCAVTGDPLRLHREGGLLDHDELHPVLGDLGGLRSS